MLKFKSVFHIVILLFFLSLRLFAKPIDIKDAQTVGLMFMQNNTSICSEKSDIQHVYTFQHGKDLPLLFVFNVNDNGFVIVSADDLIGPIIGYSTEGSFDPNIISPEFSYYVGCFTQQIEYMRDNNIKASQKAIDQWELIRNTGNITATKGTNAVDPLCKTRWNQGRLYNDLCPEDIKGPGGKVYAGCVACAMSQVMKFWNYPPSGKGSHSYTPAGYPSQSANYGETFYNFSAMPLSLNNASSDEEVFEIAQLMYHCGVGVNMGYSPSGSGANSNDVPDAVKEHFLYSDETYVDYMMMYNESQWKNKLKASIDNRQPLYYSGASDDAGHAFVCDGYDFSNYFHFNWGWGGSADGFFAIDSTFMFPYNQAAAFNFVPKYPDNPNTPRDFSISSDENYESVSLSWINPNTTAIGQKLTGDMQIILSRNGSVITSFNSVAGDTMQYIDKDLTSFGYYTYSVYAIADSLQGFASTKSLFFGSNCSVKIDMVDMFKDGWADAKIMIVNEDDVKIAEATLASGSTGSVTLQLPPQKMNFLWIPSSDSSGYYDKECSFKIFDANNHEIYSHPMNHPLDSAIFLSFNFDDDCSAIDINYYGIDDPSNSDYISVTPNPAHDFVTIESCNENLISADLFDETGRLVTTCQLNISKQIDISHYKSGLYIIKIRDNNNNIITKKLIIK